jgi:hypothetical protein
MGAMNAGQASLPFQSERKTLLHKVREHDAANLQLAREVLADSGNPRFAHLLDWARRVVARVGSAEAA